MAFLRKSVGVMKDPSDESPAAGLKDPAFDIGKAREVGRDELVKRLLRGLEALLDLGGRGPKRRDVLVAGLALGAKGVAQESLAGDAVSDGAVGRKEGLGLARRQGVAFDRRGKLELGAVIVGAELQGHRQRQGAPINSPAELWRQAAGEGETAIDPGLLVTEKPGDTWQGELVVVQERGDDAGLVHGAGGLAGGVGR